MKYYLFIDETGDHGLKKIDINFPIFLLSGILIKTTDLIHLELLLKKLKTKYWSTESLILHSREIRKCSNEYKILLDDHLKNQFYKDLNQILLLSKFLIIPSGINKVKYVKIYGYLNDDTYEICISKTIDQVLTNLKHRKSLPIELQIILEKRGQKEDQKLDTHISEIIVNGTQKNPASSLKNIRINFEFKDKKDNINGLQIADLIAYPIAKYILNQSIKNPAFDIISKKIYQGISKILIA
jgi:hypothetical protein